MFGKKKNNDKIYDMLVTNLEKLEVKKHGDLIYAAAGQLDGEQILTAATGKVDGNPALIVACESGLVLFSGKPKKLTRRDVSYSDVRHVEDGLAFAGRWLVLQMTDGAIRMDKSHSKILPSLTELIQARMV